MIMTFFFFQSPGYLADPPPPGHNALIKPPLSSLFAFFSISFFFLPYNCLVVPCFRTSTITVAFDTSPLSFFFFFPFVSLLKTISEEKNRLVFSKLQKKKGIKNSNRNADATGFILISFTNRFRQCDSKRAQVEIGPLGLFFFFFCFKQNDLYKNDQGNIPIQPISVKPASKFCLWSLTFFLFCEVKFQNFFYWLQCFERLGFKFFCEAWLKFFFFVWSLAQFVFCEA